MRNAAGVSDDFVLGGSYQLEVAAGLVPCRVSLTPLLDPANLRVKA